MWEGAELSGFSTDLGRPYNFWKQAKPCRLAKFCLFSQMISGPWGARHNLVRTLQFLECMGFLAVRPRMMRFDSRNGAGPRHAHRHHLLSHVWRLGCGGHRARHRTRCHRPRSPLHLYSQPFRLTGRDNGIFYHEVPVSNYPLFEFPPYDLALASRMAEVAEFYELDLLHVHYAIPHSVSALLARQMLAARGRRLPFVTTLHGTDITLVGLDRSYLPITRFSIQKRRRSPAFRNI